VYQADGLSKIARRRIACLIPVYNDRSQLRRTLHSLNGQHVDLTAVIVDDGSDPPLSIDTSTCDFAVTLLRIANNVGIERALNAGLRHIVSVGFDYVARLDNGDICDRTRLRMQQDFLDRNPDIALVGSHVEWITAQDEVAFRMKFPATHHDIVRRMHSTVCICHPTVMFRTAIVSEVGMYSLAYPAAEDYEYFWRIARRFKVANIPKVLVQTQLNPSGISLMRRPKQLRSKLRIQAKYFDPSELRSYIGIIKTLLLLVTPAAWILRLKRIIFPGTSP
jgi:glycosyltransferase involved in cell wall biosynthesis